MSTILKTGSTGRRTRNKNIDKIIDSKISMINKYLETKVSKDGDKMTGDLNMSNRCITNVRYPNAERDAVNRKYCDDFFTHTQSEQGKNFLSIHGGSMAGILNMNNNHISNVKDPEENTDVINKGYCLKYMQIASMDDGDIEKLLKICGILKDILLKFETEYTSKYYAHFNKVYTYLENFVLNFRRLCPGQSILPVKILYSKVKDLKFFTIEIIEDLPENVFDDLGLILRMRKLLESPQQDTKLYNVGIMIQNFYDYLKQTEITESDALLFWKNELFNEMGFLYVSEALLNQFVI